MSLANNAPEAVELLVAVEPFSLHGIPLTPIARPSSLKLDLSLSSPNIQYSTPPKSLGSAVDEPSPSKALLGSPQEGKHSSPSGSSRCLRLIVDN